ncbi:hypothetical protein QFZ36_000523 [Pseudarthrobacter siccitolerans]|uniref:Uncharacterized protein n=1 Tax=Pseudarthrobacter siccitolerans TaxID=861266 RepID=A0ABU0PHC2_9MICC|nr:hypothetical protein [Pseudarthrobacter siccitolerans]MDQ0672962.1 hypothetical protein [Pseudarthrobacter siccitolerans]
MAIDMAQVNRIHSLEGEIHVAELELKAIKERRTELVTDLPEYKELEVAQAAVKAASVKLKLAIQDDRELSVLHVDRGEVAYHLHDLREMLSHHLAAYAQDTARDVIKDFQGRNRQIEISAKLSKPGKRVLDQAKLPFSQHFGVRQVIGEAPAAKQLELMQENK